MREDLYGVIMECPPNSEYYIYWEITGLLGISTEMEVMYNTKLYMEIILTLIVIKCNDDLDKLIVGADSYLTTF